MHVGINAHLLCFGSGYRSAGISRYIYNLLAHLGELEGDNYTAFIGDRRLPTELQASRVRLIASRLPTVRPLVRILWEQLLLPGELLRHRVQVLHSPAYVAPLVGSASSVVTVHDLSFLVLPQAFNSSNRLYLTHFTKLSLARARLVIADSEHTKQDLLGLLGIAPSKVVTIPLGIEPFFRPINDEVRLEEFRRRQGLPKEYIFNLGTLEPRKNVSTLLRAYARARGAGLQHKLVLAGGRGWRYQGIIQLVDQLGLRDDIIFAGFLPLEDLPLWYNGAALFVYPSLYEGFGLPVLEAMACATPVIAARSSSLPEVVGEAGVLVDPLDAEELATQLLRIASDRDQREELAWRGVRRAREFSWARTAQQTREVYRGCFGNLGASNR